MMKNESKRTLGVQNLPDLAGSEQTKENLETGSVNSKKQEISGRPQLK